MSRNKTHLQSAALSSQWIESVFENVHPWIEPSSGWDESYSRERTIKWPSYPDLFSDAETRPSLIAVLLKLGVRLRASGASTSRDVCLISLDIWLSTSSRSSIGMPDSLIDKSRASAFALLISHFRNCCLTSSMRLSISTMPTPVTSIVCESKLLRWYSPSLVIAKSAHLFTRGFQVQTFRKLLIKTVIISALLCKTSHPLRDFMLQCVLSIVVNRHSSDCISITWIEFKLQGIPKRTWLSENNAIFWWQTSNMLKRDRSKKDHQCARRRSFAGLELFSPVLHSRMSKMTIPIQIS